MQLTKGAIGNLINRYKAVLKKCHLMNTFGSLAVAGMLVMGGAGVAAGATARLINSGTWTINGDRFDSNTATYNGGAIYNNANGKLTVNGATFRECPAYTLLYQFSPKDTGQSKVK
ncbi:hypothetical protein [Desulfovibrio piger]|uniref:Uncharacterized protein n=1 Tax=Desulfovibrio piger TaxID=901 RepID=A0A848CDG6_9BACT|nr:hypothetical protein [Desulfovibrio piger]NME53272.1 hypothetical protein [Desulfovibrio piger]